MELEYEPQCMTLLVLSFDLIKQLNLENDPFNELQAIQPEIAAIWRGIQMSNVLIGHLQRWQITVKLKFSIINYLNG